MTETNTVSLQVRSISSTFHEPEWLLQLREKAWHQFDSLNVPYLEKTDLSRRGWETGTFVGQPGAVPEHVQDYVQSLNHPYALFSNGHLVELKGSEELSNQGVVFKEIHRAADEDGEAFKTHFASVVKVDESKWAALNLALFAGGVYLSVPKNVQPGQPFETIHYVSAEAGGSYPRSLVVAGELAEVDVIETFFVAADRPKVASSHVFEVVAKAGSRVHVGTADEFRKGPTYFVTRRALAHKDATVEWTTSDVGDGFTLGTIENVLDGAGSRGLTRVIGLGYGRQHMDLTINMKHVGRNTESDIVMHGALRERANSIYRSLTQIVKGAVGAGSEQHDRMIMIDGTARADAIPMLLIDENDVQRCGHAASVGKIDPNQIYYLMSRGIPATQAMRMIIWGYLRDSVDALQSEQVRKLVVGRIERELSR